MEAIYLSGIAFCLVLGMALGTAVFLSEQEEKRAEPRESEEFRQALREALALGEPTWKQVKILARDLNYYGLRRELLTLSREALTGRNDLGDQQARLVEDYLQQLDTEEPFQGLPDEVKYHLGQIRERLGDDTHLLQPLSRHLNRVLEVSAAELRSQRKISLASLFVGLLSILIALGSWL